MTYNRQLVTKFERKMSEKWTYVIKIEFETIKFYIRPDTFFRMILMSVLVNVQLLINTGFLQMTFVSCSWRNIVVYYSLASSQNSFTMRVSDRRLSEGEHVTMKFYTSKYGNYIYEDRCSVDVQSIIAVSRWKYIWKLL